MAKLSAWLITLVGVVLLLNILDVAGIGSVLNSGSGLSGWIVTLAVLGTGVGKLIRNYSNKR